MATSPTPEVLTTIPPAHPHRTLILCFDGTDNKISTKLSSVAQFFSLLKKDQPSDQLVYYQTGIGTYTSSNVTDPVQSTIYKTMDSMFAIGIASHVKDGYEFIMQHYLEGDEICIFGFSRGAYTARALAGMIHKVGLLPRGNINHIKYAYKVFLRTNEKGWRQAAEFKRCFCLDIQICFVGIWDSVGSVGLNTSGLAFSNANTTIRTFRHALSLDEHRALFNANAWRCYEHVLSEDLGDHELEMTTKSIRNEFELERRYHPDQKIRTDVLEVWFAGCHSDIGGGSVETGTPHSLSRIPLRWMVRQCLTAQTGILFSSQSLRGIGIDPATLYPYVLPRSQLSTIRQESAADTTAGPSRVEEPAVEEKPLGWEEEVEERHDALSPIHDRLRLNPIWWILELMPFRRWFQSEESDEQASSGFVWNLGRPRFISGQRSTGFRVHRSVKTRMEDPELNYRPKAHFLVDPIWVD